MRIALPEETKSRRVSKGDAAPPQILSTEAARGTLRYPALLGTIQAG
jgi:hypothetical protein